MLLLIDCKRRVGVFCDFSLFQGVNVVNFSTSWNDGLAFCALIHYFCPESFDFNTLDAKNRKHNFQLAFDTAE